MKVIVQREMPSTSKWTRNPQPPGSMTEKECESSMVGVVLANIYNLRKITEPFGQMAENSRDNTKYKD